MFDPRTDLLCLQTQSIIKLLFCKEKCNLIDFLEHDSRILSPMWLSLFKLNISNAIKRNWFEHTCVNLNSLSDFGHDLVCLFVCCLISTREYLAPLETSKFSVTLVDIAENSVCASFWIFSKHVVRKLRVFLSAQKNLYRILFVVRLCQKFIYSFPSKLQLKNRLFISVISLISRRMEWAFS